MRGAGEVDGQNSRSGKEGRECLGAEWSYIRRDRLLRLIGIKLPSEPRPTCRRKDVQLTIVIGYSEGSIHPDIVSVNNAKRSR